MERSHVPSQPQFKTPGSNLDIEYQKISGRVGHILEETRAEIERLGVGQKSDGAQTSTESNHS